MPCPPRESSGRRAETPGITRGARRRTRLRRGFFLARAGSRSPFPAAGRQVAVVGAAPRPSSDHLGSHTTPPTTQCKPPGPQPSGRKGSRFARPTSSFYHLPPKEATRGTSQGGVSVGLACATSRFLPPPQKHHQMGCFGSGLACIRVGALQNYFLPPPPFPVGALSTVPVGLATRICLSGLGYNRKYLRRRKAALRGGRPSLLARFAKDAANHAFKSVLILRIGMPPKKGRGRPKKQFKGAAAWNKIE